jgi:cellulose synthase/poly-beta-1,6-N-acetylglucosamine synthase-like glycosyltransferase
LGGTTLFLRRDALMEVGAWDAHNVTEDADLGLRLARRGWQTGMLPSVTLEEANCRPIPWIKQRSRWTKGYLMTWLVHMRAPATLLRDLGPRRFAAVQVLIVGSLMQGIATPVLWSLWLVALGLPHPVLELVDRETLLGLTPLLLGLNILDFGLAALAMRRAGHAVPWLALPLLKPYALLTSFAAGKALIEAITRPFHWDKTRHGHFDNATDCPTDDVTNINR